jgi:hypothetical protein
MTWTEPDQTTVGVWERVVVTQQSLYISIVVLILYFHHRTRLNTPTK